jgi:Ras family protein A
MIQTQQTGSKQRRKLVIVGDGACGKTSLVSAYAQKDFPLNYMPTVFENTLINTVVAIPLGRKKGASHPCEVTIWDTAGQEDFDRLRPLSYPDADIVLLCFSIDEPNSLDNILQRWHPEIVHFLPNVPRLVVGLKGDRRNDSRQVTSVGEAKAVAEKIGASGPYLECSALNGDNVEDVFEAALKLTFTIGASTGYGHPKRINRLKGKIRQLLCLPHDLA